MARTHATYNEFGSREVEVTENKLHCAQVQCW